MPSTSKELLGGQDAVAELPDPFGVIAHPVILPAALGVLFGESVTSDTFRTCRRPPTVSLALDTFLVKRMRMGRTSR